jgi:hypothetical protein
MHWMSRRSRKKAVGIRAGTPRASRNEACWASLATPARTVADGTDTDLKTFAQQTMPKIQDHLERAVKLERELKVP